MVSSFRPSKPLPFQLDELYAKVAWPAAQGGQQGPLVARLQRARQGAAQGRAEAAERARAAPQALVDWIIARQEADGCWGGIQPPWVYSIMALHLMGYGLDNPVVKKAIDALERLHHQGGRHAPP